MKGPYGKDYKCIPALCTYIGALPEQWMLALVKGGSSVCSCPRCTTPTESFHLPYTFSFEDDTTAARSKEHMKSLYKEGKKKFKDGQKTAKATEHERENSFHIVKYAFWELPIFDIHRALTVDDLYQLGGVYYHLLECIERMLKDDPKGSQLIKRITTRATLIPSFRNLCSFKTEYLVSSLTNPTFSELKDHMAIFLVCVHDLLPPQAVRCMRHFIDFFHQATAKEHSKESLADLRESLKLFNEHSPIFEQWLKSNLRFPKYHALWKYAYDIEQLGSIGGFSTTQSEAQHKTGAKKLA
ncbi:hypothetical protein BJV82DRAFT_676262 [Fennellomyces sp. T-0311]|nr:hypothetical protein BJV82DRAFT_676262 [Fennellomyces sp. T-0311]